jgi:hypothetical protein
MFPLRLLRNFWTIANDSTKKKSPSGPNLPWSRALLSKLFSFFYPSKRTAILPFLTQVNERRFGGRYKYDYWFPLLFLSFLLLEEEN